MYMRTLIEAMQSLSSGDNEGAIADYNRAIELNPEYTAAYANRGVAKFEIR